MRLALVLLTLVACGSDPEPDLSVEARGAHPVGLRRIEVTSTRPLPGLVWYPAAGAEADFPIEEVEVSPRREAYADLLGEAPATCATRTARAAWDAPAADGRWPVIAFSHCHECTRFSGGTIAERLASHGFVVVAVDHVDNTLYEWIDGTGVALDAEFLPVRAGDVRAALDAVLAEPYADGERVGVVGHSFGAVTAGLVAQDDARVDAAFAIAAPIENPLLEGVSIAALDLPLGFLVAVEDNSITELGNTFLRDNFAAAPGPAWKLEVADAGHWTFSDLVGLPPFPAGCGDGARQTDGAPFTYLDAATGRAIAATYVTAFFKATLLDDAGARAYLTAPRPGVVAEAR